MVNFCKEGQIQHHPITDCILNSIRGVIALVSAYVCVCLRSPSVWQHTSIHTVSPYSCDQVLVNLEKCVILLPFAFTSTNHSLQSPFACYFAAGMKLRRNRALNCKPFCSLYTKNVYKCVINVIRQKRLLLRAQNVIQSQDC